MSLGDYVIPKLSDLSQVLPIMLWIYATSVGALTYDYAVRTLQFSGVSHNIVDVLALNWLSNDELGDYVALKLSVQIPVSGLTGNAVQNCIYSIFLMTFHFGDGSENGFPT